MNAGHCGASGSKRYVSVEFSARALRRRGRSGGAFGRRGRRGGSFVTVCTHARTEFFTSTTNVGLASARPIRNDVYSARRTYTVIQTEMQSQLATMGLAQARPNYINTCMTTSVGKNERG